MAIEIPSKKSKKASKAKSEDKNFLQRDLFSKSQLSNKQKENFYNQLAVLMKSGMSLSSSFEVLLEESKKNEKKILEELLAKIIDGKDLYQAMENSPTFTPYEVYSVMIGEETADLQMIFQNLAQFYKEKIEQRRQIISALSYPVIILLSAVLVIFFMIQFVIPTFEEVLLRMGGELPQITQIILSFAAFSRAYGFFILLFIIGLFFLDNYVKSKWQSYKFYRGVFITKIPIVGGALKISAVSQFFSALAMLTKSNVSILRSLEIVQKMIKYPALNISIEKAKLRIEGGDSLFKVLKDFQMFDAVILNYVKVAEESNQLGYYFQLISEKVKSENEQKIKLINAALEPILIFVIGGIVGFILIALYLPIFELSNSLG